MPATGQQPHHTGDSLLDSKFVMEGVFWVSFHAIFRICIHDRWKIAMCQATDADPEPEDLIPSDTRRDMKSTGASQWYKVYGRSVPPSVDARAAYYGPKRPLWKGGATSPKDVPAYLKGEYPGDYGCDVLGLCKDPAKFATLRAQELFNGRWAMLGIVGCIVPELISPSNPSAFEPVWFKAGAQIFSDAGIDYLGLPGLINAHNIYAVAAVQLVLMGGAELARSKAAPKDIDSLYPGGKAFDPLGFSSDAESFADLKVKEIKNGRLAMLAMAGLNCKPTNYSLHSECI
jgi:hypothetical protein